MLCYGYHDDKFFAKVGGKVTCVAIITYVDICCIMMQLGMRNVTTCEMVVRNGMILITFILS